MTTDPPILDGHNDLLSRLAAEGAGGRPFVAGRSGAIDLAKARAGGFAGGFFAVYCPSSDRIETVTDLMADPHYELPLPAALERPGAADAAMGQIAILLDLDRQGALRLCRSVEEIRQAMAGGEIAAILHIEGAEALDPDLDMLDVLHAAGLRSLGPVWSRPTIFGHGVPLAFPADPEIGPGLTEAGIRLVKRCNTLGIMIDLSHLNAAGLRDVARHSDAPLVATHSNAHAICPHARNLTDDQLAMIRESDGMVGLNFGTAFLREDGRMIPDVSMDQLLRHLDHLIEKLGETRVGLGSDYDGAVVPAALKTVADLPVLRDAMRAHGYDAELMARLCHGNWLRVLEATWRPEGATRQRERQVQDAALT